MVVEAAVLIVSRTDLLQTTTCLREEGYRALGVADEVAAAEALRNGFLPPLLIVDFPASWGREGSFLSLIRAYHPRAAVIAVLAPTDADLEGAARAEGYDDVIVRPLSRSVLVGKVQRLLAIDASG